MRKLIGTFCKTCEKQFTPKSDKNKYCSRTCFRKDYYHRKKAEEISRGKHPAFTCPECGQHIILDFDPAKETIRWLKYICGGCNTLMISVTEDIIAGDVAN